MIEAAPECLSGQKLLVVEDEYIVATDFALRLEDAGAEVVGPAGCVKDALELIEIEGDGIDAAVLDVNLGGELVYPVADALAFRGVPFVFTTGYDASAISPTYAGAPRCEKPIDTALLARAIAKATTVPPRNR
jgi:DNA-binding NtrC family response regulator